MRCSEPSRALYYGVCYRQFRYARATSHLFHGLRDLLARAFAFQCKVGGLAKHPQRAADGLYQLTPLQLTNQSQAVDDVADGQVGRDLARLAGFNKRQRVGAMRLRPARQAG